MDDRWSVFRDNLTLFLAPMGFHRDENDFVRPVSDCYQVLHLEPASPENAEVDRFYLYIGVFCERLQPLPVPFGKLKIFHCHWLVRTSDLERDQRGEVFRVDDSESVFAALPLAFEVLDFVSSYEALIRLPKGMLGRSDDPPGAGKWDLLDEHREKEGLARQEEIPYDWTRTTAWHERRYGESEF